MRRVASLFWILLIAVAAAHSAPSYNVVSLQQNLWALRIGPRFFAQDITPTPQFTFDASNNLKINCVAGCAGGGGGTTNINVAQLNGVALGSPSNYGTSPGAVPVIGVNAFVTNTPSVAQSGTWTVQQGGAPWSVSASGNFGVTQQTSPWIVSCTSGANCPVNATLQASPGTDIGKLDANQTVVDTTLEAAISTVGGRSTQAVTVANAPNVQKAQIVNPPFQPIAVTSQTPIYVMQLSNGSLVPVYLVEGQATMGNSLPVAIASNQSAIPVNSTEYATLPSGSAQLVSADQLGQLIVRQAPAQSLLQPCNAVRTQNCQHF